MQILLISSGQFWEAVRFRNRVTWPARARFGDACFDMFLTHGIPPERSKVIHGYEHLCHHRPVWQ